MTNTNSGSGTQWNINSQSAGRDINQGNTYEGPVAGNDLIMGATPDPGLKELAKIFAAAQQRVQQLPEDEQTVVKPVVAQVQAQAEKIQKGDESPETQSALEKHLRFLVSMAPDIAQVITASLVAPGAGLAVAFSKIIARAAGTRAPTSGG